MSARPKRKEVESEKPRPSARALEAVVGEAAGTVPSLDNIIHERARLAIVIA